MYNNDGEHAILTEKPYLSTSFIPLLAKYLNNACLFCFLPVDSNLTSQSKVTGLKFAQHFHHINVSTSEVSYKFK